jgi:hypothetical protein
LSHLWAKNFAEIGRSPQVNSPELSVPVSWFDSSKLRV